MQALFQSILEALTSFFKWSLSNDFMVGYVNLGGIPLQRRYVIFGVLALMLAGWLLMKRFS